MRIQRAGIGKRSQQLARFAFVPRDAGDRRNLRQSVADLNTEAGKTLPPVIVCDRDSDLVETIVQIGMLA